MVNCDYEEMIQRYTYAYIGTQQILVIDAVFTSTNQVNFPYIQMIEDISSERAWMKIGMPKFD